MLEKMLVRYGAPTLAGLKTGSVFSFHTECADALLQEAASIEARLAPKGVCLTVLSCRNGRALLYLYRKTQLKRDIESSIAHTVLQTLSYPLESVEACVQLLAEKVRSGEEFPHEIGLFLGYPSEDVLGFLLMGPHRCKCEGCWKVYGDERSAAKRFAQYEKCTRAYTLLFACGRSLEDLTVTC